MYNTPATHKISSPAKLKFENTQLQNGKIVMHKHAVKSTGLTTGKYCSHCKRIGHVVSACFTLHPELRPTGLIMSKGL